MLSHWTGLEFTGGPTLLLKRFGFRWCFVAGTALLAICLPFVNELMGLIGDEGGCEVVARAQEGGGARGWVGCPPLIAPPSLS